MRTYSVLLADLGAAEWPGAMGWRQVREPLGGRLLPCPFQCQGLQPREPDQPWSGGGRRPVWVHKALAGGRTLAGLEIR